MTEFNLTSDHVKLLSRTWVQWQYCETGAPEIDPKRPYGNSDVYSDVAEILGWELEGIDEYDSSERTLSDEQLAEAARIHEETTTALQIVLQLNTFEPGLYVKTDRYSNKWKRA